MHDNPSDPPLPATSSNPVQPSEPAPEPSEPAPAIDPAPANEPVAQAEPLPSPAQSLGPYGEQFPAASAASAFAPPSEPWQVQPSAQSWARRWWVLLTAAVVIILGGAAILVAAVTTKPARVAFPVDGCVSLVPAAAESVRPVEESCGNSARALYRIVARGAVVYPVDTACTKYTEATKAVAQPLDGGDRPKAVLCLAPTRFNLTDPGALLNGDCVGVQAAGESITRVDCDITPMPARVLAIELHPQIPVTDHACQDHPLARRAYAQASLGGRAVVVCAVDVDPKSFDSAQNGDCSDGRSTTVVSCSDPAAVERVLTVQTMYGTPPSPECANHMGANAASTTSTPTTDLVMLVCLGPANLKDSRYAGLGDCIAEDDPNSDSAAATRLIDCADPKALYQVTDRHESNDNHCPAGTAVSLTYGPGVTNGTTICMRRR
ncbi:hypothetical protein [Nocardia sp. NPDC020380]|uniref:LppU/SCO3897 family protein n=1 Tax=Nocardia sp. NPDC020380 TaxID=3364309 RepID=UPI0037968B22